MKFLLIASALNLQLVYPNEVVCQKALDTVVQRDPSAMCIPKGEHKSQEMFAQMIDFIQSVQQLELNNSN